MTTNTGLTYREGDQLSPNYSESELQTVVAEQFVQVHTTPEETGHLEGVCFDRTGDYLYFCDCWNNKIRRVNMNTKEIEDVVDVTYPASVKIHKDGRVFVAYLGDFRTGGIMCCNPDGSDAKTLVEGPLVDDLVFDKNGGFFYNDFIGDINKPTGTIYYMCPDEETIVTIAENLASPNGIGLSPDESILWASETATGRIIMFEMENGRVKTGPARAACVYQMTGFMGPDSIDIDGDGNVYVAAFNHGRILVLNSFGYPIGQVVMPGKEKGLNMWTTHATVRPDTNELYVCSGGDHGEGTSIFCAKTFANANMNSYQFL